MQAWIDARQHHHLSHAQVQMVRELGMNPSKPGKLDNHDQEPWKMPLTEYIEHLYLKRFGRPRPQERSLLCLLFEYAAILGLVDVAFIPPAGARRDYHRLWGMDDLPFFSRYDCLMFCLGTAEDYKPRRWRWSRYSACPSIAELSARVWNVTG